MTQMTTWKNSVARDCAPSPTTLITRILYVLALAVFTSNLEAQTMVVSGNVEKPVTVRSAAVRTEVSGSIAVTTFDLEFYNPNPRALEGSFEFPLLDGQQVVRFALDINGKLREAVPVEKTKGRVTFETIERRRVDPGLLEQTSGNNYRARVFPLPARGTRRVVIAYQEQLDVGPDESTVYRLALEFPERLDTFSLDLSHHLGIENPPVVKTSLPLDVPDWTSSRHISLSKSDFEAKGLIELEIPDVSRPRLMTEQVGDREYFQAEIPLDAFGEHPRPVPNRVGIVWDASTSGRERNHARELELLDAWLQRIRNVEVDLFILRDVVAPPQRFQVKGGKWKALRRELESVIYDGASSLDGLAGNMEGLDAVMLFSDGLFNYGETATMRDLPTDAPVFAIVSSSSADRPRMRALSLGNGGQAFDLLAMNPEVVAEQMLRFPVRILSIRRNPTQLAQVYPEAGSVVSGDTLAVVGILREEQAVLELEVGVVEEDAQHVTLDVISGARPSGLAARAWATRKIEALSVDPEGNREDIRRTSVEFGIVTSDTSLIVLETLEDYLEFDIEPPEELRAEWEQHRRTERAESTKNRDSHLERVVRLFENKIEWWKTDFPEDVSPPKKSAPRERSELEAVESAQPPAPRQEGSSSNDEDDFYDLPTFEVQAPGDFGYRRTTSVSASLMDVSDEAESVSTASGAPAMGITLQAWSPETAYLERLERTKPAQRYMIYLEEREEHLANAGFYVDVANFFFASGETALGHRVLSNLAELQLEDAALLRILGHRLTQLGRPDLALPIFERVLKIREEEPQSYRDLALVHASIGNHQQAVDLLWTVVSSEWDARFPEIELIALGELNAIAARHAESIDLSDVDPRLRRNLPVGLRVILTWDTDNTDIDLWVDDPSGERAKFDHPKTKQGGRMSRDFTAGYGPEEFLLKKPMAGDYTVRINYYGSGSNQPLGPVTVQLRLIKGFGTPEQEEESTTLRLTSREQVIEIGRFDVSP